MECKTCNSPCIKKGSRNGRQKYYCRPCRLHQQKTYCYKCCTAGDERMVICLNNEGVGISGIARITGMSKANVIKKIRQLAARIARPEIAESRQEYEVDEMRTYIGNKQNCCYITYAINRTTRQVIDFVAGARTSKNIGTVIGSLTRLGPGKIYTDKLNIYPALVERQIHVAGACQTNRIERHNLTLRTHLKRLSRKTICFSKNQQMLESCLRIYLWGRP